MKFKLLSKAEAAVLFKKIKSDGDFEQSYFDDLTPFYTKVRNDFLKFQTKIKDKYLYDLDFGLYLYEYFSKVEGFDESTASNYDFWRYLSLKVLPDLVIQRHGLVENYFYDKTVRIYLSTLWWYIHITYQGTIETTRNVLVNLNTDYILQLVERPGKDGFFIEITREIIKKIDNIPREFLNRKIDNKSALRRIMIQNTAKAENYNLLLENKVEQYVIELFDAANVL